MNKQKEKVLIKNTVMMYLLSFAKLIIPLVSLPYLTRVLSVECYGSVSFVKSLMSYLQILIDFGFLLSGTKDVINIIKKKESPNKKIGDTLYAQLILSAIAVIILIVCSFTLKILDGFVIFAFFSLATNILSIFLFEYVFKAYEEMDKIVIRYVIMKLISLVLTILFVKSDNHVMLMPLFDIIASLVVIFMVSKQMKKLGVKPEIDFKRIKQAWVSLKTSFVYFICNFATTVFTALNTLLIGIFMHKTDVAYWTVAMQLINAIQALYSPIINSVFPTMVKEKNLKLIHKIMLIYMPLILLGCGFIIVLGNWGVALVFGKQYLTSATILKFLIPVIIFSFPSMLYGWPCLGAINKNKTTTASTIITACVQVVGLLLLAAINQFTLIGLAIVRGLSEMTLCLIRIFATYKNKHLFKKDDIKVEDNQVIAE